MSKFKVGDTVRITERRRVMRNSSGYLGKCKKGQIHKIGAVFKNLQIKVTGELDLARAWIRFDYIELVEASPMHVNCRTTLIHAGRDVTMTIGGVSIEGAIEVDNLHEALKFNELQRVIGNEFKYPNKPQKHWKERIAYALGANIQVFLNGELDTLIHTPQWNPTLEYKIKR